MDKRYRDLSELKLFNHKIDKEMTMILQSLQWNPSKLMEAAVKETCKYDANHKIPPDKKEIHEKVCVLSCQGYSKEDKLLPDPLDPNANTLVKLSNDDINQIIHNAKKTDSTFKNGPGVHTSEPCTLERLQATYSADERRAIHDAVVEAVPFCHDLTDLALPSTSGGGPTSTADKSRAAILAELRDMKRRRTKYRVAAKTRNYSDVLRDVIKTQMELYPEVQSETEIKTETIEDESEHRHASEHKYSKENPNKTGDKDGIDNSGYRKYNNHKREVFIEEPKNKETSRYYLHEDRTNTYKDRRHNVHNTNVHKKEFHKREKSNEKYMKSNRETRNDDHCRSKYNKEERDRETHRDKRYDRKYNAVNVRERYDKYQNKASSSKDYINSHKSIDNKYKDKYKAYDSREIKEEGKYKRYYDDRLKETSNEDKLKRAKFS